MKRKNKKITAENPLTEEELQMLKHSVESQGTDRSKLPHYDNSDKARFFRFLKKDKLFTVLCVFLCVLAVALLTMCVIIAVNIAQSKPNTDDFTVFIGEDEYTVKYKDAVRDGAIYIDMYKIAEFAELTKTGTVNDVKFTADDTNYLRFENGTNTAVINGSLVDLGGTARVNKNVCEVPLAFLQKTVGGDPNNGLSIALNTDTNTIKISRRVYAADKKGVYTPAAIRFYSDSFSVIQSITRPTEEQKKYEYGINVDAFLSSIDPENKENYLILANKQSPLGSDYAPVDLEALSCRTANDRKMWLRADAALSLYAMMLDMKAAGIEDVYVTSAYRAYSRQVELFEGYVSGHMEHDGMTREEAEAAALEYSARAGTSEHQTGLCVDFMTDDMKDLDESFENTAAFEWLQSNAHKYGFIIRYPKDKVDVTGYKYEPWHYRFVGRTTAAEIYNSGLCLEEYLELN